MKQKIIVLLFILIMPLNILADLSSDENQGLKVYINNLISEGYKIVKDPSLSNEQRFRKSSDVIRANLHLDWMAKFTLGRHKKTISSVKLKEFTEVYSKFVVSAYAELSSHYDGEKAIVKTIKSIDSHIFIVSMEIARASSGSAIRVDYLIHKLDKANLYRVADVITEGVSILNSQQSESDSVITNHGIDALIADLQKKNARHAMK